MLPSTDIRLLDVPPGCAPDAEFSVWRMPGRKNLKHEGSQLRLSARVGRQTVRIVLPQPWIDGAPAAFCIPADALVVQRVRAVKATLGLLRRRSSAKWGTASPHPGRASLWHMRALQALDGVRAGATQRVIAEAIFGAEEVQLRWTVDGELRAHLRHVIRRGQAFVEGDYHKLLRAGVQNRQGDGG